MNKSHLLVQEETTLQNQKALFINAFQKFEDRFDFDCSKIIAEIERHGLYFTNGELYFPYSSKLNFMKKFRSRKEDVLKLQNFLNTFDQTHTSFWTITKKTMKLSDPQFILKTKGKKVEFQEIKQTELNLRQLLYRLESYGYHIDKYILVPEIKEKDGRINYHWHGIFQVSVDVYKVRSNPKTRFQALVFNQKYSKDMDNGWISYPILSQIWKEVTKDPDNHRIVREKIRNFRGVSNYILSYMNKGIQFENYESVPYLYFAMKSKKAYRIKGLKKMPKIDYKILNSNRQPSEWDFGRTYFVSKEDIPIEEQEYFLQVYKDKLLLEEKMIKDEFGEKPYIKHDNEDFMSNFARKFKDNRYLFNHNNNWLLIEEKFTNKEINSLLRDGTIMKTRDGYKLI